MLVWRKGDIKKTLCVTALYTIIMVHKVVLTGRLTVSSFDLAWFSSLSSERLCVFGLHGAVLVTYFS